MDEFSTHGVMADIELGERYDVAFSLKIDFSQNDDEIKVKKQFRNVRDHLPKQIEEVSRFKPTLEDMREKTFVMGNREIINLLELGDHWQDHPLGTPYKPKQQKLYTSTRTQETVVASIPFEVEASAEKIFAAIYEATTGSNLLSLHIIDDESHEELMMSYQGKYMSTLEGLILPRGYYYLVIKNDKLIGELKQGLQAPF